MTMNKHDIKPCFQGVYAAFAAKGIAFLFAVAAVAMTAGAAEEPDFPEGVPADAVWLLKYDTGDRYSLTTGAENGWNDKETITEQDTDKNCFVQAGVSARANADTQTVVPNIYCAGTVKFGADDGLDFIYFKNLYMLDGGKIYNSLTCGWAGNYKILAGEDNPATVHTEDDDATFALLGTVSGAEGSCLEFNGPGKMWIKAYTPKDEDLAAVYGKMIPDWSGFYGKLRIGDGAVFENVVNMTIPGEVQFGSGVGFVMTRSCTFGKLDTGANCKWTCQNAGTFGTLVLGDGLTLVDEDGTAKSLLTVTDKLEVGENVVIEYPNVATDEKSHSAKVPVMKLTQNAADDENIPDLSGVSVSFQDGWSCKQGRLTAEKDAETGDVLVYATISVVTYKGEAGVSSSAPTQYAGDWLNKQDAWSNNQRPDGDNVYWANKFVCFYPGGATTFPGRTLVISKGLYMFESAVVEDLILNNAAIGIKDKDELHVGGNLTIVGSNLFRVWPGVSFHIDSAMHGDGSLLFQSDFSNAKGACMFYLLADNSDWTGIWATSSNANFTEAEYNHIRIVVGDARSLGAAPKSFTYNAMSLTDFAEIRFTETTQQASKKRGLCVTNGIINVLQGKTADLNAPVTLEGTLRKIGAGTLGFGSGVRYNATGSLETPPEEGKNVLLVKEGAIKGSSMSGIKVTFSDGAEIAADTKVSNLTGAEIVAEGRICLKADANRLPEPMQAVTYPIVKVSAEQAAALDSRFRIAKCPWTEWWHGTVVKSVSEDDGSVTYSVKYEKKGFVMSIR